MHEKEALWCSTGKFPSCFSCLVRHFQVLDSAGHFLFHLIKTQTTLTGQEKLETGIKYEHTYPFL